MGDESAIEVRPAGFNGLGECVAVWEIDHTRRVVNFIARMPVAVHQGELVELPVMLCMN